MKWVGARWQRVCVVAVSVALLGAPGGASAAASPTEVCDEETYVWSGSAALADTTSIDTGIVIPPQLGTTLRVVGTSADGLDQSGAATSLRVWVGDVVVSPGSVIDGGTVRIAGTGSPVTVNGATVVVARCALVAVSAVPQLPAGVLPETGADSTFVLAAVATLVTALGCAFLYAPRRPPAADFRRPTATAAGRGPGSPPDAPRPAPR